MKEISKWILKTYEFKEFEHKLSKIWFNSCRIIGFVYKDSHFCKELRESFKYTPYTFQYLLDKCNFKGEIIHFNNEIGFSYTHLKQFIWVFNPKYAVIEVCLNAPIPMIVSAPHISFEMVLAPVIVEEIEVTGKN